MRAQRGSILPLVSIGLLAIFGMAALGLDAGVVFWDKARLQNATDTAALSAAKILDLTGGDTTAASAAGLATFNLNANGPGNAPLADAVSGGLVPTFQYSATLNPFVSGPAGPYVRATAANFQRVGWFSQMFGNASFQVGATAVAGPSPTLEEVCDIAPIMACARPEDPDAVPPMADLDDEKDDTFHFGYEPGMTYTLKASGGDGLGPSEGNYFLIRLGGAGADIVRDAFAGVYERCTNTSELIDSEPGVEAGPVVQGVDTRFEPCTNPLDCDIDDDGNHDILPDLVTVPGTYAAYKAAYDSSPPGYNYHPDQYPLGTAYRRVLKVPIADCTGMAPGAASVPLLDIACFFLKEPVAPGNSQLVGEFITSGCQAVGVTGPNPSSGPGPFKIILYKDPNQVSS